MPSCPLRRPIKIGVVKRTGNFPLTCELLGYDREWRSGRVVSIIVFSPASRSLVLIASACDGPEQYDESQFCALINMINFLHLTWRTEKFCYLCIRFRTFSRLRQAFSTHLLAQVIVCTVKFIHHHSSRPFASIHRHQNVSLLLLLSSLFPFTTRKKLFQKMSEVVSTYIFSTFPLNACRYTNAREKVNKYQRNV